MKELGIKKNFLAIEKEYSNYDDSQIVIVTGTIRKNRELWKGNLQRSGRNS